MAETAFLRRLANFLDALAERTGIAWVGESVEGDWRGVGGMDLIGVEEEKGGVIGVGLFEPLKSAIDLLGDAFASESKRLKPRSKRKSSVR